MNTSQPISPNACLIYFSLCLRPFDRSPVTFCAFQSKCGREVVRLFCRLRARWIEALRGLLALVLCCGGLFATTSTARSDGQNSFARGGMSASECTATKARMGTAV